MAENLNLSTLDGGVVSVAESLDADVPTGGATRAEADERHLLEIFPLEIWTMILDNVKDPKSLYHLYQASPIFRTILLEKRVEFLFPEVIKKLMAGNYLRGGKVVRPERSAVTSKDVSHLVLRKVCSSWTHGVDTYLEQRSGFHLVHSKNVNFRDYFNIRADSLSDFHIWDYARFIRHFEPTHSTPPAFRNPFLGRALSMVLNEYTRLPNLLALLNLYGEHIRYLKIHLNYWPYTVERYRDLQLVLHACPNVQLLSIDGSIGGCSIIGFGEQHQEIIAGPPPRLPQLEALELSGEIPNLISSQILLHNPTILYLELSMESDFILDIREQLRLPNLKHLNLFPVTRGGIIDIQQIGTPDAPALATLTLTMFGFPRGGFQYWQEIFRAINNCWSSAQFLTAIKLHLFGGHRKRSCQKILREGTRFRLKLKNLEKLDVIMGYPCSLDFVLPAKEKLKWLKIDLRGDYRWKREPDLYQKSLEQGMKRQQIQFLGWERKLYESNLWSQLPNLEEITVEGPLKYSSFEEKMTLEERLEIECRRYTRKEWLLQNPQ